MTLAEVIYDDPQYDPLEDSQYVDLWDQSEC